MSKRNVILKRSTLTVALSMCLASSVVLGQSAVGSLFGETKSGATVVVQNSATGFKREISADSQGRFNVGQLSPGTYIVTTDGVSKTVVVKVGTGSKVSFADEKSIDTIVVQGNALNINAIDVSSVESTTVFTAEQLEKIPVGRDPSSVALLAPGTVKGDTGFGNLASFGGSSVAENGYYINGFDVTNIRNFVSYASLPFEAIGQQQVKTGGYGAEYGRSLGGVINIVTKSGTNEWKGGMSMYWRPESLTEKGKDVLSVDPIDAGTSGEYLAYRSRNSASSLTANIYGGGPLIEDKLFIYGMVELSDFGGDVYGSQSSYSYSGTNPNSLVKIDWNINDNHKMELTAIHNKGKDSYVTYQNEDDFYQGYHGAETAKYDVTNGGDVFIGKYTGYLTDNFNVSLQAGRLESISGYQYPEAPDPEAAACPRAFVSWGNPGSTVYTGCYNLSQLFIRDPNWGPDKDTRTGYRADAEWRIGDHFLRFGYDQETFTSGHAGTVYTGGIYWRHYDLAPGASRTVNGQSITNNTANPIYYARSWDQVVESGSFDVVNTAFYVEDSWQATDNLLLYAGVRSESFENSNAAGEAFVSADNNIAPRLGFSWDVSGDSSMKVFGNAGRYFIPVASNTNIRASGVEYRAEEFYYTTGYDAATGCPTGTGFSSSAYQCLSGTPTQIGPTNINGSVVAPNPATVAQTNLSPMYQDEFILGFQKAFDNGWTGSVRSVYREVKSGMDDFCSVQPFQDWADDNGYDDFDYHSLASCFIMNPGSDVGIAMDLNDDGNLTNVVIPAEYFGLPKYQRKYASVEFVMEKVTDKWAFQGSYTWSHSYGNVEGYVNSSLEQDDAGLTQDFDNKVFEDGAYGDLPNDRRHVLKAFGSYKLNEEWRVGGNFIVSSGRPVNCLGFAPVGNDLDSGTLAFYSASSFYCKQEDGTTQLGKRGQEGRTPWTWNFDLQVSYRPEWADKKLELGLDVFNLFNNGKVTEYYETSAYGSTSSNFYEPNFLQPVNFQAPRNVRISARWEF